MRTILAVIVLCAGSLARAADPPALAAADRGVKNVYDEWAQLACSYTVTGVPATYTVTMWVDTSTDLLALRRVAWQVECPNCGATPSASMWVDILWSATRNGDTAAKTVAGLALGQGIRVYAGHPMSVAEEQELYLRCLTGTSIWCQSNAAGGTQVLRTKFCNRANPK